MDADAGRSERERWNDLLRAVLASLEDHFSGEGEHAQRTAVYAVATGHALGWDQAVLNRLRDAAWLHDVGKLAIEPELLRANPLGEEERAHLRRHVELAGPYLRELTVEPEVADAVLAHHERPDGGGYPRGLRGDEIPSMARVLAVAEAFDAMTYPMGWREPVSEAEALAEIERGAGPRYDPEVVAAFRKVQPLIQPVGL